MHHYLDQRDEELIDKQKKPETVIVGTILIEEMILAIVAMNDATEKEVRYALRL
jgi:hypothetical protein